MESIVIYQNEYIKIIKAGDVFFIESYKRGMSLEELNLIIKDHAYISLTSFITLKNAITLAPRPMEKFGVQKDRIIVELSGDELKAYVTISAAEEEVSGSKKGAFIKEVVHKLGEVGIVFGVKHDAILNGLVNGKKILVAEGIPPVNGVDSVVKMYEIVEVKPEIKEDGKVDHYELSLINKVNKGEWLGERTDPTLGEPGKTVNGKVLPPMPGKAYPLLYDKETVTEVYENCVTTLYAKREGAVHYDGERISVSNYLEITDNVDFKTGNIDFEGFVTVKGSIEDNFSVCTDNDIEILGDYGVGSVKEIVSRDGSIYIRGGIAGQNRAVVKSKKDIFTKYVADAEIICEGSVHIGFYCLNSNITAKEVIIDSSRGQIMGGNICAEIKVVSAIIGTPSEKRTQVSVKGFNRAYLKEMLEKVADALQLIKNELVKNKQELSIYTNTTQLSDVQVRMYELLKNNYFELCNKIKILEDERKRLTGYLKTHGEGEIAISKKVFPNTMLQIKNMVKEIDKILIGVSFYLHENEMKQS